MPHNNWQIRIKGHSTFEAKPIDAMRQMLYKPEFVGSFISLVRRVKSMQMNWMTIVAIIVIVVAVGFLLMRRKSS